MGFESTAAITNKASYVAYRGPWASETFVRERVLDLIAKDLGLDPVGIRLRNIAARTDPPASMITGRPLVGVTTSESLERVTQMVDFPAFRRQQAEARAHGRYLGTGVATFIEAAPGPRPEGPGGGLGNESMRLRLTEDGVVALFTGQMPHGQGHQTTLAQIAADEFGVPFEQVRVVVENLLEQLKLVIVPHAAADDETLHGRDQQGRGDDRRHIVPRFLGLSDRPGRSTAACLGTEGRRRTAHWRPADARPRHGHGPIPPADCLMVLADVP